MANNSIKNGTKVRWYDQKNKHMIRVGSEFVHVTTGLVVAQSRQGNEVVIVEWDNAVFDYPVSTENVEDLVEISA